MKTIVPLILALFCAFTSASAQVEPKVETNLPSPFTWTASTTLSTAYVGKIGQTFYDGPVSINYLDLNYGDNWTFEAWSSTALNSGRFGSTFGDELDLFAIWHRQFGDFRIQATAGLFLIKDLDRFSNDLWVIEVEASYTKYAGFQPYLAARYFGQVSSESPGSGWFGWAGFRGTYPTWSDNVKVTLNVFGAYSDGAFGKPPGLVFARAALGLPIKLGKNVTLTPAVFFQTPIGGQDSYLHDNKVVGAVTLTWGF